MLQVGALELLPPSAIQEQIDHGSPEVGGERLGIPNMVEAASAFTFAAISYGIVRQA